MTSYTPLAAVCVAFKFFPLQQAQLHRSIRGLRGQRSHGAPHLVTNDACGGRRKLFGHHFEILYFCDRLVWFELRGT